MSYLEKYAPKEPAAAPVAEARKSRQGQPSPRVSRLEKYAPKDAPADSVPVDPGERLPHFEQRTQQIERRAYENSRPEGEGLTGLLGDMTRGGIEGGVRGAGGVARAVQWVAPEGSAVEDVARGVAEWADERLARNAGLFAESKTSAAAREESPWNVRGWAYPGLESLGMMTPGLAATVATGNPAVGMAVTGGQFWGDTAQQVYDAAEGLSEQERVEFSNVRGGIEGGVEALQHIVPFKVARLIPKRLRGKMVAAAAGSGRKAPLEIGKDVLKTIAAETPMEMGQEYGGGMADYAYGQRGDMPGFSDVAPVIGPTIVMSGLLGTGVGIQNNARRKAVHDALTLEGVPVETRMKAVALVEDELRGRDAEMADLWTSMAVPQARKGDPVAVDLIQKAADEGKAVSSASPASTGMAPKPAGALERAVKTVVPSSAPLALPAPAIAVTPEGTAIINRELDAMINDRLSDQAMTDEQIAASRRKISGKEGGIDDLSAMREEAGPPQEVPSLRGEVVEDEGATTEVDAQAHEAATSPANDRPEPTQKQIEAGNYKMGKVRLHGLDISIENPAGSTRKGVDEDGKPWETPLAHHYGYIRGTVGKDKDHVDVFVKPGVDETTAGESVFVVDQVEPKTGELDEHKVLMGFATAEEAREAYLANYDESGPQRIGAITETGVEEFRRWLDEGDTKKPFAAQESEAGARVDVPAVEVKDVAPNAIVFLVDDEEVTVRPGEGDSREEFAAAVREASGLPVSQAYRQLVERFGREDMGREQVPETAPADLEPSGEVRRKDGSPFVSERSAKLARNMRGLRDSHDVAPAEGGFVLRRRSKRDILPEGKIRLPDGRVVDERRRDDGTRRKVDEMSPEEMRRELLVSSVTGLGNRRAYDEAQKKAVQASLDADSLKWVNDNMDHASGDKLLAAIGKALKEEGAEAYHVSGDEFIAQANEDAVLRDVLERVARRLEDATIEIELPDGSTLQKRGLAFSYGIAGTLKEAEHELQRQKQAREERGERAARGEEPPGVSRIPSEGVQDQERHSPAQEVTPTEAPASAPLVLGDEFEHQGLTYRLDDIDGQGVHAEDSETGAMERWDSVQAFEGETGRRINVGDRSQPDPMVAKSRDLQDVLRDAGFAKGSGVSSEGLKLVTRLARENGLRDWPDTRNEADYDALIEAVKKEVAKQEKEIPTKPPQQPVPGTPGGMSLLDAQNLLIQLRTEAESQGRVVDDRLLDRIRKVENLVKDMEGLSQETADPATAIADAILERFKGNRETLTWQELFQIADEAYGGTQGQGTYTVKDAYDALELAVNRYISEVSFLTLDPSGVDAKAARKTIEDMKGFLDRLPTQTKRTEEMDEYQQFSTPPTYAYAVNWLANLEGGEAVLEPSAGVGGLAVFAQNAGAKVTANELSERRASLLRHLDLQKVTTEKGELIDAILPQKFDAVVMNPPFSSAAGRIKGRRKTIEGGKHVEAALRALKPGGRLVAIVGKGMAHDAPGFRDWWTKIEGRYNVRANVGIDGAGFRKYGTTFDNQILVIDNVAPQDMIITGKVQDIAEIPALLEEVRNDRPQVDEPAKDGAPAPAEPQGPRAAEEGRTEPRPDEAAGVRTDAVGAPERGGDLSGSPQRTPDRRDRVPDGERDAQGADALPAERTGRGEEPDQSSGRSDGRGAAAGRRDGPETESRPDGGRLSVEAIDETPSAEISDSVYEPYRPQRLSIPGSKNHPGNLVQSAAMASVSPPAPSYAPDLPREVIEQGKLSIAQLESVVYAGQAHTRFLPSGEREGFFIGDGTGVGKGREISGIILDNYRQGRTKAVWVSETSKLVKDAQRDAEGVGLPKNLISPLSNHKLGTEITGGQGVVFTTYSTLASGLEVSGEEVQVKQGKQARIDQLVQWLGEDFDGVLVFDEAHNMQNSASQKGNRGVKKASARGLAGVEIQRRLPKARVVYVSATGATEVENLGYASRLGLWGEGTAFANRTDFIEQIKAGGLAAMELVARDLKAMGKYIARSLDFTEVSYGRLEHPLTDPQRTTYDTLARGWQTVLQNINAALEEAGAASNAAAKSNALSKFWGSHQRFFNQVITSMQMPSLIEAAKKDVQAGKAVVLQLVSTNEAATNRQIAKAESAEDLENLDLTPREALMQYIERSFPVQQYEEYEDEEGNLRSRPVFDSQGNPVLNQAAVRMRETLLDQLGSIKVPDGPLEMILSEFGAKSVAEVTGRTRRIVRDAQGKTKVERWSASKSAADADAFMADKKAVLVFSEAGGTGRSYHADLSKKNQRDRVHYLVQPGWRADKAVQGFGRTHRTNQASAPHYVLVTTDLQGQRRFISSIARRLNQLGALTKGQRDTGSQGLFSEKDNLESEYARDALQRFFFDLYGGKIDGLGFAEVTEMMGLDRLVDDNGNLNTSNLPEIPKFLNRILSLEIGYQNRVFDAFAGRMEQNVETAILNGTLDVGLETYRAAKVATVSEQVVFTEEESGAQTKYVELEASHENEFVTFAEAKRGKGFLGFYRNKKSGKLWAVREYGTKTDKSGDVLDTYRFQGSKQSSGQVLDERKFTPEPPRWAEWGWEKVEDAKSEWTREIESADKYRKEPVHLISGAILPIWDRLPSEQARVMRVQTDEGNRYLGRLIPAEEIAGTLKRLGATPNQVRLDAKEALQRVMEDGWTLNLANGWRVTRRMVSGEPRAELVGDDLFSHFPNLEKAGVFKERINYSTRYFIPSGDEAALKKVLNGRPIVEAVPPGEDVAAARYKTEPATLFAGDSGLGEVEVTSGRSLSFVRKVLEQENLEQVSVKGGNVDALRQIGKQFGKRIVFFRERGGEASGAGRDAAVSAAPGSGDAGGMRRSEGSSVSGFVHPKRPDIIYLNVESANHALFVAGHELSHTLRIEDPALWRQMAQQMRPLIRKWGEYRKGLSNERYARLTEEEQFEELMGDVIGENFLNEAFWRDMGEQDAGIFRKIARKAVALLNKALRLLAGRQSVKRYVTDMTQARAIVSRTLLDYGQKARAGMYERFARERDGDALSERIDGAALLQRLKEAGISEEMLTKAFEGTRFSSGKMKPSVAESGREVKMDTNSDAFKKWFGESVVTVDGKPGSEPLVVYHGTSNNFDEFSAKELGSKTGAKSAEKAFFFAESPRSAEAYLFEPLWDILPEEYVEETGFGKTIDRAALPPKYRKIVEAFDSAADEIARQVPSFEEASRMIATGYKDPRGFHHPGYSKSGLKAYFKGEGQLLEDIEGVAFRFADGDVTEDNAGIARILAKYFDSDVLSVPQGNINRAINEYRTQKFNILATRNLGKNPNIVPVYLRIENPLVKDYRGVVPVDAAQSVDSLIGEALVKGHDGVVFKNIRDGGPINTHYAVFSPTQIKSIFNDGTFAPENPDIRYSIAQSARDKAAAAKTFAAKLTPDVRGLPFQALSDMLPERMKAAVGSVLSNPHYGSRKSKHRTQAYELALERGANANEIKYEVMAKKEGYEGLEGVREAWRKMSRDERAMLDKLLVEGDIAGKEYSVEDLNGPGNPLGKQAPQAVQEAYHAFRQTLEKSTETMFDRLGRLRLLPYEETEYYQELIDLLDEGLSVDQVAKRFGIEEKAVDAYHQIRAGKKKLDALMEPYKRQGFASSLREVIEKGVPAVQVENEYGLQDRDLITAYREVKKQLAGTDIVTAEKFRKARWYKTLTRMLTEGDDHPMLQKLELLNAYRGVKEYDSQLAKLKEEWRQAKGYLPRIRKDGEQHVKVFRVNEEDGTFVEVFMQPAKTKFGAEKLREDVEKNLAEYLPHSYEEGADYMVVVEPNQATPEEIFLGIGSHRAIEGLLSKVFDKATDAGIIENQLGVQQQVLRILADEISARGFGRHRLARAEHLIEGYETENTPAILAQFVGGMAGWLSKSEFAMRANKLMSQIPADRPHDKSWVREYVDDNLKNSTYLDQWFGTARSFAALMFLGFKASSAMLNATQNYVWGQAQLSKQTKGATRKLLKAQHDVVKDHLLRKAGKAGILTEEERWVMEEGIRRGRSRANYVRAMAGMDDTGGVLGKGQKAVRWLTEKAMIPFQAVETYWNREPALLAAFRVYRAKGMSKEQALKEAERFTDDVHFVIGKENIPGLLRKMGPLGRTLYTFQSYTHNYLLGMVSSLSKGEYAVVMRSLTALALFGGLAAMPFGDDLDRWYRRVYGERPLRMLEKWLRATAGQYTDFGDQIADFVMHGAPALGGVNFSRALAVQVPWFSAEDETMAERVTGVWGGLAQKVRYAAGAAGRGDLGRAAEYITPVALGNVLRAYRHATDGATTMSGRPVFGDDGKQERYTAGEAVIRAFGFMPLRPSKQSEARWDARSAKQYWQDRKSDVLARFRIAEDRKEAMKLIREFNRELRKAPGGMLVPPITANTLRQALRSRPNRRELAYRR